MDDQSLTFVISWRGRERTYIFTVVEAKADPRSRDDQYAEGWVANITLGYKREEVARTSAWETPEDAIAEGVHYLLTEWRDG